MTRETVGKISTDTLKNSLENTHSAHDQMKEMIAHYEKNINELFDQSDRSQKKQLKENTLK